MDKNKQSELKKLVNRFTGNIKQYEDNNYKEFRVRADFIDPFFELLDWDLGNKQGFSEAYRDVIREDQVMVGGQQKAPDYCFKIGVEKKFFVEAKKPSVDIKKDIGAAYQLRRYAYSAKLPLSILTDFHEFAVYDTRIKPKPKDKAEVARIFYCKFDEYEQNFEYIYNTFSKDAILKGSFDRYVADTKKKKGTSEVDKEFLKLIEDWRNDLAKNIAVNNLKLDLYSLNTAVQKIIDRIIFLRIAEARNIEPEDTLSNFAESSNIYKKLDVYFQQADKRYNSGLFKIENWLSDLKIDDKVLKELIKSTYYPESPYEFSVLPVEILGNIYEQFLGKVIHLTATHQAKIEEKPEVKKAGGVYYTPQYIVDYIVKNTVGEKVKDSTPEKIEALKILDPACGSGSFLLGAYAYLLRWHLDYYTKDKKSLEKYKKLGRIYDYKGDFKLTIDEKKKILKNNIFGVDIDGQAVEVTKLSLLLKLMEDETQQSAGMLIKYNKEALLPDLSDNIKCGNSLIGTDFYGSKNMSLFGTDEMRKVNAFDWEKEFKDIFDDGGFDAVIGNPPWVSLSGKFGNDLLSNEEIQYLMGKYKSNTSMPNLYENFIWKGLRLVRKDGVFSFIVPDRLGYNKQFVNLRKYILDNFEIQELQYKAKFPNIVADTLIFIIKNKKTVEYKIKIGEFGQTSQTKNKKDILSHEDYVYSYEINDAVSRILKKIDNLENKQLLNQIFESTSGFGGKSSEITEKKNLSTQIQIIKGKNISRYYTNGVLYFDFIRENITGRTTDKNKLGIKDKILLRKTGYPIYATYDNTGIFPEQSLYFLFNKSNDNSFFTYLAIINSKVFQFYYWNKMVTNKNSTPQLKKVDLDRFPFPKINKAIDEKISILVGQMLEVQKKFHSAKNEADKKLYQQKIEILDKQIDAEVYKLYGLTEEEIKIVEGK